MKTLLLVLFILFSEVVKGQIFNCDSTAYYPNVYEQAYSIKPEKTVIILDKGNVKISNKEGSLYLLIKDTLEVVRYTRTIYVRGYIAVNTADTSDRRLITFQYDKETVISVGLLRDESLFIFHVMEIYFDTRAKKQDINPKNSR